MPSIITNKDTEDCLRGILEKKGYELNKPRKNGELGTDIIAKKNSLNLHIEVIGYKKSGPARARDFYEAFFRAISRLNNNTCATCIIAMPVNARTGLPTRARVHRIAWERIAKAFPELEIWLVDVEKNQYFKHSWLEWLD